MLSSRFLFFLRYRINCYINAIQLRNSENQHLDQQRLEKKNKNINVWFLLPRHLSTSYDWKFILTLGKNSHAPSNYHSINNIFPKLPIETMSSQTTKNLSMSPKVNKMTKMTLEFFSMKQKYSYNLFLICFKKKQKIII